METIGKRSATTPATPQGPLKVQYFILNSNAVLTHFLIIKGSLNYYYTVSRDKSLGGTFEGVEAMALLWSMRPVLESKPVRR